VTPEPLKNADIPSARALWRRVFGDTEEFLDEFFRLFYREERALAVKDGARVVSMGFLLDAGRLAGLSESVMQERRISMIYAVATEEAYRNRGYAAEIVRELAGLSREQGFYDCILHPAEPALFGYYEKLGFLPAFYGEFAAPRMLPTAPCTPEEYSAARRGLLDRTGEPYLDYSPSVFALLAQNSRFYTAPGVCAIADEGRYFGLVGGRLGRGAAPQGMSLRGEEYFAGLWLD
jgi:ribosomal protein S18 acetylase RimI-like enzyme